MYRANSFVSRLASHLSISLDSPLRSIDSQKMPWPFRLNVYCAGDVSFYVTRLASLLCLSALMTWAADADLKSVLRGVESRYNRAKTLRVTFSETFSGQGRPRQSESGQLVLRKPGRMRWDYTEPAGKLFLSDGKQVYLYSPDLKRVEKMPLKESEDMRAPMAFLLGKLEFEKEFRDISLRREGNDWVITGTAKSDRLPYSKVTMWIAPDYAIRKLVVNGQDYSVLAFQFDSEQVNVPVDDEMFRFRMPAGATLVNGETAQ